MIGKKAVGFSFYIDSHSRFQLNEFDALLDAPHLQIRHETTLCLHDIIKIVTSTSRRQTTDKNISAQIIIEPVVIQSNLSCLAQKHEVILSAFFYSALKSPEVDRKCALMEWNFSNFQARKDVVSRNQIVTQIKLNAGELLMMC